jgi:chemotaxis methyl-accepting protein methylase
VDFSAYRAATVERRIRSRMMSLRLSSFPRYLELLRTCDSEPQRLIERVAIKVSRFYRHAPTFDCLRHEVLPELATRRGGAPLGIWSVGTGAGEEAYTLAMLLDEAGMHGHIEASDIDPSAGEAARTGIYPAAALAELPRELTGRYLEPVACAHQIRYRVSDALRRRITFSHHDLTRPGDARSYDLVVCRNVLIYLQPAMQARALGHLRAAMKADALLCLGEAECPTPEHTASLTPVSRRTRIYRAHTIAGTRAQT